MKINNRFGLVLTLAVATTITAIPAKADTTASPAPQKITQPVKGKKVVPVGTTKVNPKLDNKIKVIQPDGGIQGKDGDFKDSNPLPGQPTFGEADKPGFVNFKKETPGSVRVNPSQKVAPSAVQKMQKIQNRTVPAGTTKVNPKLNNKIKVIQPGGALQGKDGDFKDSNPLPGQPTFGEADKPGFVNFKKETPGSVQANPSQKVAPSAVQKMQKLQNPGK